MIHVIDAYLSHVAALGRADTTVDIYRRRLRDWINSPGSPGSPDTPGTPGMIGVTLADLTAERIAAYHDELIARGLDAATRRAYLTTIAGLLTWAYKQGRTISDLAERIELPKRSRKLPPTPLSQREVIDLLDAFTIETLADRRDRAMIEVLYACGLRASELMGLSIGDLDFTSGGVVWVRGKGGKERLVPIHDAAQDAVADYLDARRKAGQSLGRTAAVFVTDTDPPRRIARPLLDCIFRRINQRSARRINPHLFRHTFAVHLLQGGADLRHVQALLGHESPDTTSQYLGFVKADLKHAYDAAIESLIA